MLPIQRLVTASSSTGPRQSAATVLWDHQHCLPLTKILSPDDIILLLSPVVVPFDNDPANTTDPFQPFGLALASRHPLVRHVPYTKRSGITSTHATFIKRARVVIFVVSGLPGPGEPSQTELAEVTRIISEQRPHIILACCNIQTDELEGNAFSTIIQIPGYSSGDLEEAAALLFGERDVEPRATGRGPPPRSWPVDVWNANHDMSTVHELWRQCLPQKFWLSEYFLGALLKRDGYAMHYVVRQPASRKVVGFCATYTTYADSGGDRLIGSLAIILVAPHLRGQGIGVSLHDHALRQIKKTRGVYRLQLGSTFPRLLYGPPSDCPHNDWFRRRGWEFARTAPGKAPMVCDWVLNFEDMPQTSLSAAGLRFRCCEIMEFERKVLPMVEQEQPDKDTMGWYDQYAKLANSFHIKDVMLGLEGDTIVAAALTYVSNAGSPVADDLPWARTLGDDVGGVTCIVIQERMNSRNSIMIRLLDACIRLLKDKGMNQLFIDGVKGGDVGFQTIGFQKWASYCDVWQRA